MIPLSKIVAESLCESWGLACSPLSRYRLLPKIVRANLLDHPLLHPVASVWIDESFVAIKRSAASLYEGPDLHTAHLSLLGGKPEQLTPLLRHATEVLLEEGFTTLVVGMDSGHFLPGAPVDIEWLGRWLESEGFLPGGIANDLERDLVDYTVPPIAFRGEFHLMRKGDEDGLNRFLAREFPGRWHYDVMRKVAAEGIETVYGLFVEDVCEGFALLQHEGCRLPIGGAVWQLDLGPRWCSLGPIGISKALRGHGLGNALLGHALAELRRYGAYQTIIDWTALTEFYGAHGFKTTRSYRAYRLNLSDR